MKYIENKLSEEELQEIIASLNQKDSDVAEAVNFFVDCDLKDSKLIEFNLSYSNLAEGEYYHYLDFKVMHQTEVKEYNFKFALCLQEYFEGKIDFLNWYEEEIVYVVNSKLEEKGREIWEKKNEISRKIRNCN